MPQVRVIARLVAKIGCEAELRAAATGMLAPTHAEPGGKVYDLFVSDDPRRLYFVETWESQAAFDFHAQTPHFKAFAEKIGPLLAEPLELNFVTEVGLDDHR